MNIKWNWGTKLTLFIILFMGFIFVLVYLSTKNSIILVEKDYYPKGLRFQDRIDELTNAHFLKDSFEIVQEEEFVVLNLPEINPDSGTVVFYRLNNNLLDLTIPIDPDTSLTMHFPAGSFEKGKYLLKVHWFEKEKGYFVEKPFFFE
jgi:hypothetical protein